MKLIFEKVMPPKTGLAVTVKTGQHLRVIDLEGQQVVDMAVFRVDNLREKTATGSRSISDTRTGIIYQNQKECAKAIEALNLAEMDRMLALRADA